MFYISLKFHETTQRVFHLRSGHATTIVKFLKGTPPRVMVLVVCMFDDISKKLHENIFNCFQAIELTQFCDRTMDEQMERQEIRFLSSTHRLMMLYILMKYHENVLGLWLLWSACLCNDALYEVS